MMDQSAEEFANGDVTLKVVHLEDGTDSYWIGAGFGHLEYDRQGLEDLLDLLCEYDLEVLGNGGNADLKRQWFGWGMIATSIAYILLLIAWAVI